MNSLKYSLYIYRIDRKYRQNTAATEYGVKAVPASFLIDPNGKVVGKDLRDEELNKTLAQLFK